MWPEMRYLLLLVTLLIGGCATGPDYVRPEADIPEAWRVPTDEAASIANIAWWKAFGDPVLDELIETALLNNKDLRIAAARGDHTRERDP